VNQVYKKVYLVEEKNVNYRYRKKVMEVLDDVYYKMVSEIESLASWYGSFLIELSYCFEGYLRELFNSMKSKEIENFELALQKIAHSVCG